MDKAMDTEADTSHPKVTRMWEPGKCIPQAATRQDM
jgi:hypothetical protein